VYFSIEEQAMKSCRMAYVSILIVGFAICSPKAMAQVTPVVEAPSPDAPAVPSSSRSLYRTPILPYTRPTEKEKLKLFGFDAFGPYAFAGAIVGAGFQQNSNSPPEWGRGWSGFGDRVASNMGIQIVSTTTRYGMAEIFHEDVAYYRCGCKGFLPRLGHALVWTVTARHGDDGRTFFSMSQLVSPYVGTMTALAWYPSRYGVKDGFRMGNYNLLAQVGGNVALEFIYGGPHTLLRHFRSSNSSTASPVAQNP
jgi:hypothetical protein